MCTVYVDSEIVEFANLHGVSVHSGMQHLARRLEFECNINIELVDSEFYEATCGESDEGPDTYSIEISECVLEHGIDYFLETLVHETVHVKQFAKGELRVIGSTYYYNDVEYKFTATSIEEYKQLPWEEEAYRLEKSLSEEIKKLA
jgi:hypothetical protein